MKKMMILLLFSTSIVHAELKTLDSQALREVEGQAGADLSLKFSLNHTSTYQLMMVLVVFAIRQRIIILV